MTQKILLVEGISDQNFYGKMCKVLGLDVEVTVNTPKDYGAGRNGKIAAFNLLETLMAQLADGSITHLAMVIDADFLEDGWGFFKTLEYIKNKIIICGYDNPNIIHSGFSFPHTDGLNNFGLWIMPNNESEGMLEDWIKGNIKNSELLLLQHAVNTVENLPEIKFKAIHKSKAEIATWMAWQKIPGEGLETIIENQLVNMQSILVKDLTNWLSHIYK